MKNPIREMTSESHLKGNRYFRVIHGKSDKSHSVGLHKHDFIEIMWIKEGDGILISNGKLRKFSKNFLYISTPNEIHVLEPAKNSSIEFSYVVVQRETFDSFKNFFLKEEPAEYRDKFGGISIKLSPVEITYLNKAASELAWQDDSLLAIHRFLINLYWQIKNAFMSALPNDIPDWLADACQSIRNPENLKAGLEKFREICGKNMSYINRTMRRYLKCTPTEFINDGKLRYAKWMLETSSFSTGEISEMCGFSDLPYFCRKFRAKYEKTPSEVRKRRTSGDFDSQLRKQRTINKVKNG